MGTDFAVVEECNEFSECDEYSAGYEDRVYIVEYKQASFAKGCSQSPQLSIVLRDKKVITPTKLNVPAQRRMSPSARDPRGRRRRASSAARREADSVRLATYRGRR